MPLNHPSYLMPEQFLYTSDHQSEDSLKDVLCLSLFGEDRFHHISLMYIHDLYIKYHYSGFYSSDILFFFFIYFY